LFENDDASRSVLGDVLGDVPGGVPGDVSGVEEINLVAESTGAVSGDEAGITMSGNYFSYFFHFLRN